MGYPSINAAPFAYNQLDFQNNKLRPNSKGIRVRVCACDMRDAVQSVRIVANALANPRLLQLLGTMDGLPVGFVYPTQYKVLRCGPFADGKIL